MEKKILKEKAKKQILLAAVLGFVLIIADIAVSFSSNDVKMVKSNGHLYMVRPAENSETAHVQLKAKVLGERELFEKNFSIALEPYGEERKKNKEKEQSLTYEEKTELELKRMVSGFNDDSKAKHIELPSKLESGEKILWEKQRSSNTAAIMAVTLLLMVAIYKNRFSALEKKKREEQQSVIRQLPEFVNRLVLLMNAGLVINTAFEKAVKESMEFSRKENDYFYENMKSIYMSVKTANGSMHREFRAFAKSSGIKELMRISNIISDNISKGVELTQKLQSESEILWLNRKKSCEERGRLAETKLTFPLVIFLMVLVMITIAPALLEL